MVAGGQSRSHDVPNPPKLTASTGTDGTIEQMDAQVIDLS
jgi:hypothetical protein